MEKIEYIYDPEEMYKAIRKNASEMNLSSIYTNNTDFKEAIAVISQKQTIMQPVYISHPIVALNVIKQIISGFSFSQNPIDFHSDAMRAVNDYSLAIVYFEDNRFLNFVIPDKITDDLSDSINAFVDQISEQEYSNTLLASIGDFSFEKFDASRIKAEVEKRKSNIRSLPVQELIMSINREIVTEGKEPSV